MVRRAKAHVSRNRRRYSVLAVLAAVASALWAVGSNLIASAIAPLFGLPG